MHAACHEHLHLWHLHWKICHNLMVMTVPVQHLGMQLHTLLGMQAGDLSLHSYAYMGVIQYSLMLIWMWSCNLHFWLFETLIHCYSDVLSCFNSTILKLDPINQLVV